MPGFDLGTLGWNSELAENLEPGLVPGRVAAVHRGAFDVWTEPGAVRSRLPGRQMHEGLDVGVGDWVGLSDGLIRTVLPRRSAIVRNAAGLATTAQTLAANIDVAFVVSSLGPDLEPRRIERYLVTIWESGATPEIVLTKSDRLDDPGPMVAEGIGAVVLELRNDFPDAKILLLAIFPRGAGPTDANRRKIEECNKIIAKLDDQKHVFFTSINDKFLTPEGRLIGFRTTDNLHPVTEGFEIWISSVAPTLKSWVK